MLLRQEDLSGRAVLGPPLLDMPLEGPQLPLFILAGPTAHQILEQRPGLQLRCLCQTSRDLLPVLSERILARPPRPRLLQLRRQLPGLQVPLRRIPVQAGPQGGHANTSVLAHLVHQLPHLCILDQFLPAPPRRAQDCGPWRRPEAGTRDSHGFAQE